MKFEHVDLPKGQFVRLQPVSSAWLVSASVKNMYTRLASFRGPIPMFGEPGDEAISDSKFSSYFVTDGYTCTHVLNKKNDSIRYRVSREVIIIEIITGYSL